MGDMSRATHPKRQLHLIDVENLAREARPSLLTAATVRDTYEVLVEPEAADHLVIACNHGALLNIGCAWCGARLLTRSGENGADHALLDVLETEDVATRYDGVVLGSGDKIFVDAVATLRSNGMEVTVVAPPEGLSRRLAMVASRIVPFVITSPQDPPAVGIAA
jgi:hypothetical protein